MPRYQVPMFVCVDAESAKDAVDRAMTLEGETRITGWMSNAHVYLDSLLPVVALADNEDDPDDLETAVRDFMES